MHTMGLVALYPKRNLSLPAQAHKVYPYLVKDHDIRISMDGTAGSTMSSSSACGAA